MQWIKQESNWVDDEKVAVILQKINTTKTNLLCCPGTTGNVCWQSQPCHMEVLSCEDPNAYKGREPKLKGFPTASGQLPGTRFPWISSQKWTTLFQETRSHFTVLAGFGMVRKINRIIELCSTVPESSISQAICGCVRVPERQAIVWSSEVIAYVPMETQKILEMPGLWVLCWERRQVWHDGNLRERLCCRM